MTPNERAFRQIIQLTFPPEFSGTPVLSHLVREFDLTFNILKGAITPRKAGYLTVEIEGSEANWKKAKNYLKTKQIQVVSAAQQISRDEDACMHCGICTAICPASSLVNDSQTRTVLFVSENCTACGMCTRVCPVGAMRADVDVEAELL